MPGSNRRPLPCEGSALPAAPIAQSGLANRTRRCRGLDTSRRRGRNAHRRRSAVERHRGAPRPGLVGRSRNTADVPRHARVAWPDSTADRRRRCMSTARFVIRSRFRLESLCTQKCGQRGCGAVVAHHLAKVRVASSNLVIRSDQNPAQAGFLFFGGEPNTVDWPRGEAAACKAVYTGSNPVSTSKLR